MGVSDEGKRESVLRVDGDGGQGKGHRLGTGEWDRGFVKILWPI